MFQILCLGTGRAECSLCLRLAGNRPTREDEVTDVGTVWGDEPDLLEPRNRIINQGDESSCLSIIRQLENTPSAVSELDPEIGVNGYL